MPLAVPTDALLRLEWQSADTASMRRAGAWVAAGIVAALMAGAAGGTQAAWASDSGRKVQLRTQFQHGRPYKCIVKIGPRDRGPRDSATGGNGSPPPSTLPVPRGSVEVEIPPVVIVRARSRRLVVTTNTGQPPNPQEAMYYLYKKTGGLAPQNIRDLVLSGCTTPGGG
jgi:hypothetical protein